MKRRRRLMLLLVIEEEDQSSHIDTDADDSLTEDSGSVRNIRLAKCRPALELARKALGQ